MLTQDTKKHIDAARQILVGVVPNPMSQVEQITNALIYKFMDDMDQQAIKAGGDPSFFVKDLEKYAWTKVMDSRLGNQERMNLYTEALMKFSEAKQLPQLFRDIFKQAFLPYRDPEVLGLFLKEISYFDYTHSEELGNAYEYLLSIMSSQGDAGQFRTPRHIIDFIVDILAPTKDDTILDPACGTAGFLISAYNYIKKQNEGVDSKTGKMKQLTADERRKLINNFEGYDVDPTMVRMSQVNMYLHKFTTPKIYNYNTLTSEDRWNDKFDIILANPPFMSPKGGIKPHNKFSVPAKKSEILFTDYITEHLNVDGRAAIIIPDGIISNSPNAYVKIRRKLVEDNLLYAVVSLPAGIFLPYSDVKTTILFIDKKLAKKTKQILFIQVKNEGYDLGSTRRSIIANDLPFAIKMINSFKKSIISNKTFTIANEDFNMANIQDKNEILLNSSVSLSGKRYKNEMFVKSKHKSVKLGTLIAEFNQKAKDSVLPVWSVSNSQGFVMSSEYFGKQVASEDTRNYKKVLKNYFAYNPARINVGSIALNEKIVSGCVSPMYIVFRVLDENIIRPKFLLILIKSNIGIKQIFKYSDGAVRKILSYQNLSLMDIPLPSIEEQDEILKHFKKIEFLKNEILNEESQIEKKIEACWGNK